MSITQVGAPAFVLPRGPRGLTGDVTPSLAALGASAGASATAASNSAAAAAASAASVDFTKDTDGTLAANSDLTVPSQKAVVTYVTAAIAAIRNGVSSAFDTLAEIAAVLINYAGDSGSGSAAGFVPPSSAGDAAKGYMLHASGLWRPKPIVQWWFQEVTDTLDVSNIMPFDNIAPGPLVTEGALVATVPVFTVTDANHWVELEGQVHVGVSDGAAISVVVFRGSTPVGIAVKTVLAATMGTIHIFFKEKPGAISCAYTMRAGPDHSCNARLHTSDGVNQVFNGILKSGLTAKELA